MDVLGWAVSSQRSRVRIKVPMVTRQGHPANPRGTPDLSPREWDPLCSRHPGDKESLEQGEGEESRRLSIHLRAV